MIHVPKYQSVEVKREGGRVLLLMGGELKLDVPWEGALQIAQALHVMGKKCEEQAKASQIADDQAILLRSGFRLGLSAEPAIMKEAAKRALHDPKLRKYIPSQLEGIKSLAEFGVPTVTSKKENSNG